MLHRLFYLLGHPLQGDLKKARTFSRVRIIQHLFTSPSLEKEGERNSSYL